jgi:hypothetical protein
MSVWARAGRVWAGSATTALLVGACVATVLAVPAAPTLNPPLVAGPQVTLSWSAVPGALGYRVSIGLAPGVENLAQVVGPVTSVSFAVPFVGTGYVRAQAIDATGVSAYSNEVVLSVTSLTPVPAAPVNLQSFVSGRSVSFTWGPGAGGGAPLGVLFEAGTAPGLGNLGAVPLPLSTSGSVPNVPPGTYFARVYAVNASGRSAPSNEVRVDVGVGGGCSPPPLSALSVTTSGSQVSFTWTGVPGVVGYRLEVATGPAGPLGFSQTFGAGTTSFSYPAAPAGTYYGRIVSLSACGLETGSGVSGFTVAPTAGGRPRAPNPPPGQRLPLPDLSSVAYAIGNAYRGDLRASCVASGGNNVWLYRLVQALRQHDTRWGLNWKRGNRGDMSQDVVTYNFSADADEGTTNVYIIDVIAGHCGGNPQAAWIDNTEATRQAGTIGRWTLQPYLAAGGIP